jgi:proline dehydrogenase
MRALTFLARRFVAGETAAEAVAVGRTLHARGIRATFDLLGEDVRDADAARRSAAAVRGLLRAIPDEIDRNVSIKLSMMGLDISGSLCLELAFEVLGVARERGAFVRIDMEGSRHTQATLETFRELRRSFDNVGIVLQACLHRTEADVEEAIGRQDRVRLCKGAYKEPESIAWSKMDRIRASFQRSARRLLEAGTAPAFATHDEGLIQAVIDHAREKGIPPDRFEFQMLYGLRPRRWAELVGSGFGMRVYVPFGTHWLPYFTRRLRERKENVLFVLRNLLGG